MFDSVGEVYLWLSERGWRPKWHTEPQDSVDFTIKAVQSFLTRLVQNESTIGDQVIQRKKQLELAAKLEKEGAFDMEMDEYIDKTLETEQAMEYEGAIELEGELEGGDDDCLN